MLTRDQMEAHLTLQGWRPMIVPGLTHLAIGNDKWCLAHVQSWGGWKVIQYLCNPKSPSEPWDILSDAYFWILARHIEELNHADA